MRLVGISLLSLILVGTVFVLSLLDTRSIAHALLHKLTDPTRLVFEATHGSSEPDAAGETHTALMLFPHDRSVILSGLPAYQSVQFQLPRDARPIAGRLSLELTAQALPGTEAVLRVQIGGLKRAEVLLGPGTMYEALEVELSPTDLVDDELKISFSVLGKGPTGPCDGAGPLSTTVEIEPRSALELVLDTPLSTPRDLIASRGGVAQIGWPRHLNATEATRRLALAAERFRSGGQAVFIRDAGPGAVDIRALEELAEDPPMPARPTTSASIPIAADGQNAGLRRFSRQTKWRFGLSDRDLTAGYMASRLDLSLALGPLPSLSGWMLDVTLDGRLIHAEAVRSITSVYQKSLSLPKVQAAPGTQIEITVTSSIRKEGTCDEGPELIAELRADSLLHLELEASSRSARLREALASANGVRIEIPGSLTPPEATAVAHALGTVTPHGTSFHASDFAEADKAARVFNRLDASNSEKGLTHTWRLIPDGMGRPTILAPGETPHFQPTVMISLIPTMDGTAG